MNTVGYCYHSVNKSDTVLLSHSKSWTNYYLFEEVYFCHKSFFRVWQPRKPSKDWPQRMLAIYWWVLSSTCSLNWITPKCNGNTVARSYTWKHSLQESKKPTMFKDLWWVHSSTCNLNWIFPKCNGTTVGKRYTWKHSLQDSKKPTMFKDLWFSDGSTHQLAIWIE